jgi:hypothetical protein
VKDPNASLGTLEPTMAYSRSGLAQVGAMIGGLIHRRRPLSIVLTNLCELIGAAAQGHSSSKLLFDRAHTRIRHTIGPGLPAAYNQLLVRARRRTCCAHRTDFASRCGTATYKYRSTLRGNRLSATPPLLVRPCS